MLFNSPEFLFGFLPIFLFVYAIVPDRFRNLGLFLASLLFYFISVGELTLLLLLSVLINWALTLQLSRKEGAGRSYWLAAGVVINLAPLLYYKYAHFFLTALNDGLSVFQFPAAFPDINPPLPAGISFFTFQALSYIADVAMRRVEPARGLIDFGMYHSCFPQLIAGPIVRYEEIAAEVHKREHTLACIYNGIAQFCFGLGKKVILADSCGRIADAVFQLPDDGRGFSAAWIGIIAYSLQIFFDFSGYSDMAIGLGRMLGFPYPVNFNQPYLSRSVTEFWRRWHMTLSRWFRDYVYIPLGGNRLSLGRTLFNLVAVFFLCGLWHGAAYTFVVWGLLHGLLLIVERGGGALTSFRPPAVLGWAYTVFVVMLAWVFFRAHSLAQAAAYLRDLVWPAQFSMPGAIYSVLTLFNLSLLGLALVFALTPFRVFDRLVKFVDKRYYFGPTLATGSLAVALISIFMISIKGFSPFIYFRF